MQRGARLLFHGGPGATGRSFSDFPTIIDSITSQLLTLPPATTVRGDGVMMMVGRGTGMTVTDVDTVLEFPDASVTVPVTI